MSDPRSERRGDVRASDVARALLGRLDTGGSVDRAQAVQAWRAIAGEEVSRHALGFAMRRGELVVYTDSAVWAGELAALSEHYREEINAAIGQELVRSVRFSASKKFAERNAWISADQPAPTVDGKDSPERVEPIPATPEERLQVEAMASGIHSPELRAAAIGAALRGLELKKGREASGRVGAGPAREGTAPVARGADEGENH